MRQARPIRKEWRLARAYGFGLKAMARWFLWKRWKVVEKVVEFKKAGMQNRLNLSQ